MHGRTSPGPYTRSEPTDYTPGRSPVGTLKRLSGGGAGMLVSFERRWLSNEVIELRPKDVRHRDCVARRHKTKPGLHAFGLVTDNGSNRARSTFNYNGEELVSSWYVKTCSLNSAAEDKRSPGISQHDANAW